MLFSLCRYHYCPLDQQTGYTLAGQDTLQRFYCKNRIATEIHGDVETSIFRYEDELLAQHQRHSGNIDTSLLAFDKKKSVLNILSPTEFHHSIAYTPYGHHEMENNLLSVLGFNGERPDNLTGCYHLGNGYRQFNPLLMRFCSPDNLSPFGKGGVNAYAYCEGEPILRSDPDGHFIRSLITKPFQNFIGYRQSSSSISKQLISAKAVRLDGVNIKMPDALYGNKSLVPEVALNRADYMKLDKVKLNIDRYAREVEIKNKHLMEGRNFDKIGRGSPGRTYIYKGFDTGQAIPSERYQYKFEQANSLPMRELLQSIERMDNARIANKVLWEPPIRTAKKANRIRQWIS